VYIESILYNEIREVYFFMEPVFKKVVETPADVLNSTIEKTQQITKEIVQNVHIKKVESYWKSLGPGFTTGAADDDPSGIATYSQTGSQYGFQLLWLSIFTFPFMAMVQEMCARLGLVTGRGLAGNIRKHFPRNILYISTIGLFFANTLNIGADLGAMAKATQLLVPSVPFWGMVVVFSVVSLGLQIFISYNRYAAYLKYLALVLFAYVFSGLLSITDWPHVISGTFIPHITFSKDQIILITGILGTTISPYLFFWQTSQEVEEKIEEGKTTIVQRQGASGDEIKRMRVDVWSGMFISNLIMFFIIATCAATLNASGITTIATAEDAAQALRPIAGNYAYLLFSIGIIGAGLLAIPILAGSASYALSESLRWKFGLNQKLKQASAFYGAIIISILIGLALNFVGIDPIKALLYAAVVNGLVAPLVLVFIVTMSSSKKIMGEWVNSTLTTIFGWCITGIMFITGTATIVYLFLPS
jgi:NRAMP (natural resistance-associated macrophage protein)-like metal ion transporter